MLHRNYIYHIISYYIINDIPLKIFHSESRSFQWCSHEPPWCLQLNHGGFFGPSDSQELRSHVAGECWQARDQCDELRQAFLRAMPCHVGSLHVFYHEILVHFLTMKYRRFHEHPWTMRYYESSWGVPWGSCWFSFNTRRGPGDPRAWISMAQMAKVGAWTARDWR